MSALKDLHSELTQTDPDTFTFSIQMESTVQRAMRQVREQDDAQIKALLREVFEAGEAYGDYLAGIGEGYQVERCPDFEEWLAAKLLEAVPQRYMTGMPTP